MAALISLLFLLILVGALVTGIILWATSGSGGSGEMSCRACGYAVRGLSELNCPECGVDLREAGIGKGGSPGKKMAGIFLTFGSVGVFVLLVLLSVSWLFVSTPAPSPASISLPAPSHSTSGSSTVDDVPDETATDEVGDEEVEPDEAAASDEP